MSHFMIVVPSGRTFEVGLADGIYPWTHHATCKTLDGANEVCTLLAMHYKVPSRTLSLEILEALTSVGDKERRT